jgi:hypothetical protein
MENFSFNTTAGASQGAKPKLAGNQIHEVTFNGCEVKDVVGVKDPTITYKQLLVKFSNEDGYFEHTVWGPKPEDFTRVERDIVDKQGKPGKIVQPSGVETMMLFFKHMIDEFNPTLAAEIDKKTKQISAKSWEDLRQVVIDAVAPGKGKTTKIKLIENKNGEPVFPYFSGLTKDGRPYVKNNIIGAKLAFTDYEKSKISAAAKASPTATSSFDKSRIEPAASNLDLDFEV